MQKVYIETSVINRAFSESITGNDIAIYLDTLGFQPTIGTHTIYELAKTYLEPNSILKAQQLFSILLELEASIIPPTDKLFKKEIMKLRTGAAVLPFLDTLNQSSTRQEIHKLANGIFDSKAQEFIKNREKFHRTNNPIIYRDFLDHINKVKSYGTDILKNIRTFEDVVSYFKNQIPDLIVKILKGKVSKYEAVELFHRLDSFPALRSAVRANIDLCFICIVHNTHPGSDRKDDNRHIVDSSYSKGIVTGDEQLAKRVNRINPELVIIAWKNISFKYRKSNQSSNHRMNSD